MKRKPERNKGGYQAGKTENRLKRATEQKNDPKSKKETNNSRRKTGKNTKH